MVVAVLTLSKFLLMGLPDAQTERALVNKGAGGRSGKRGESEAGMSHGRLRLNL